MFSPDFLLFTTTKALQKNKTIWDIVKFIKGILGLEY